MDRIESELLDIIRNIGNNLPKDDLDSIKELVSVGEYAVAFENFCTQLYEYDVAIKQSEKDRLNVVGIQMRLDKALWDDLLVVE